MCIHTYTHTYTWDFPGGLLVMNPCANVGDPSLIPASGRCPGKPTPVATHSSILAWKIPWTEEPGGHGVTKDLDMT